MAVSASRDDERRRAAPRRELRPLRGQRSGKAASVGGSMTPSGLAGKAVLVTGGSRGIGRAIVELFADEAAQVTFFYRGNAEAAQAVVGALRAAGHDAHAEQVDVRDSAACHAAVERIADRAGRIDVLVNNAGVIRDNPLTAQSDEDVKVVLDTNVGGVFNVTRAVAPYMVMQRAGCIVNLSSVAGEKGGRGQTNYAASKGAIDAFTRALAGRARAGDEEKAKIMLKRYGTAQDVANAVWFLASDYAAYVTGQVFHIDGGFKFD